MSRSAGSNRDTEEARQELIRFLEADDCQITYKVEMEGRRILRDLVPFPSQWAVFQYVLNRLKEGPPLHAVPQGDPPGSLGLGYELRNVDGQGLYIKLKLERGQAWVISFHY